ncbi:MAG: precorrin-2 C(20)-methyltransferase [Clostridia bacterium]
MRGTLYGVGVGPGDKKLLTLLAVETLQKADKIIVPNMGGEKTAQKIAEDYIKDKEKLLCYLPMTRDENELKKAHEDSANLICSELEKGYDLAFITLGDPTVYSTYMYIHRLVLERGHKAEIINGIPSFCAVAAKLNISLCDKEESLHIIPASYQNTDKMLDLDGNKVLMKSGKQIKAVTDMLKEKNIIKNAKMVECCCMENEKIYTNLEEVSESSYFSVIIVKEKNL